MVNNAVETFYMSGLSRARSLFDESDLVPIHYMGRKEELL